MHRDVFLHVKSLVDTGPTVIRRTQHSNSALTNSTIDRKPLRLTSISTDTADCVSVQRLEKVNYLEGQPLQLRKTLQPQTTQTQYDARTTYHASLWL